MGIVTGFTLTSIMTHYRNWRWSFYMQAMGMVPCALGFLMTPNKYLDIEETVRTKSNCTQIVEQKLKKDSDLQF